MSEIPDILLFAAAVIGLFVWLWLRKPKHEKVDNEVTRAGEALRPFVDAMKDVDKRGKELYERCRTDRTLAERAFDTEDACHEVFMEVHAIMGGAPLKGCNEPGYFFPCITTQVDPYDSSVEVILDGNCPDMTREQADKIIALGFDCVYESKGDVGRQWCKTYVGKCSPRNGDAEFLKSVSLAAKLEDERAAFEDFKAKVRRDYREWYGREMPP